MTEFIEPELVPVSMLAEYAYCPRSAYMQWIQKEFTDTAEVTDGKIKHRNVDRPSGNKKLQDDDPSEKIHARSITLSDKKIGLIAKMDLLELEGSNATPVEYKRGKVPDIPEKAHEHHKIQICGQGLLLRAHGYTCTKGIIYYISSKQRIDVPLSDILVEETKNMLCQMRKMADSNVMPMPLIDSPKCPKCSLVGICLPDETNLLADMQKQTKKSQIRRMYPIVDDAMPIYVQEQGAVVGKSDECIVIKHKGKMLRRIRMIDISNITIIGNIQVTTQAIRHLCNNNIPICYLSYGGWFAGITSGMTHKNVELRIQQYKKAEQDRLSMPIAREIVFGKIKNCSTLLRRNHKHISDATLNELNKFAKQARTTKKYDQILGIEGMAARIYFSEFCGMLKKDVYDFDFNGRNKRPPLDPVNAILSFLYMMLTKQATVTLLRVGLDPYLGFLHKPRYGKPALALDLIEEFRPIIADSVCITMINNGELSNTDIIKTKFGVNLTTNGRNKIIYAFEKRMDTPVTHPLLGYVVSYRRIIETQARLLSRYLLGEIPSYPSFRTR